MIDWPWPTLAGVAATIVVGYTVYGMSGFGANIVAMPILAQLLPLRDAGPMLAIFDICTGTLLLARWHRHLDWREIARLLPWLLIGIAGGVQALARVDERWLLLALGAFVLGYSAWSLLRRANPRPLATAWAMPAGLIGGAVTALYGTGGPIYTIYLARRLPDKTALRSTIGGVILGNALIRIALYHHAGFYDRPGLVALALAMLPCAFIGLWLGGRLHLRAQPRRALNAVWSLLLLAGLGLLWRGFHAA
ncbi:MAG: sulfite exporter TauE/SafE family protein [Burkholderiales bacterium]|nr:sulfite exporter TauE/SafE family protein [Burkholderiales bacterium]MDE1927693.1 sulfite exporter TauE/SafE family protein [Burkholderiales bacterium]MDE2157998.1 sulfite exporter TauE/SafE family protein [Burkholderiales bacterium]MDE2502104.1 sulfite exporter TauE/SafE family protein [Burkholderiales bacterium]